MIDTNNHSTTTHVLKAQSETVEVERLANESYLLHENIGYFPGLSREKIASMRRILEVECGAGVWSLEVAKSYPSVECIALDDRRSMIDYARSQARHAENLSYFFCPRLNEPLPLPDESFDMISTLFLSKVFKRVQWPGFLRECLRLLRPGGCLQLTEYEISVSNAPAHNEFLALYAQAVALSGGSFSQDGHHLGYRQALPTLLREAGFETPSSVEHQLNYSSGQEEGYKRDFFLVAPNVQRLIAGVGLRRLDELQCLHRRQQQEMQWPDFQATIPVVTVSGIKAGEIR